MLSSKTRNRNHRKKEIKVPIDRKKKISLKTTYNGTRLQRRTPLQKYKICKKLLLEHFESVIEDKKE